MKLMDLLDFIFGEGKVTVATGPKGSGKTHSMVSLIQNYLEQRPNAVVLTNVIMKRMIGTQEIKHRDGRVSIEPKFEEHYPDRVFKVQNFEDIFRLTGKLLSEDPDTVILIVLDELQNYMLADKAADDMSTTFYRYLGNTRKFEHRIAFCSPSINNIPKRIRFFIDDPAYAGYLNTHVFKSAVLTSQINQRAAPSAKHYSPRELMFVKAGIEVEPQPFEVPVSSWTRQWNELKVGDVVYDHRSSAYFDLEKFEFQELMKKVGGVMSEDVPTVINRWVEDIDRQKELGDEADPIVQQTRRVVRMRNLDIPWDHIGLIEGESDSTLRSRIKQIERKGLA